MAEYTDQWLWFVDDELVEKLVRADEAVPEQVQRPAETSATAQALALHADGKSRQALEILERAIEKGESLPELYAMSGWIRIETQQYGEAAASFANLLALEAEHRTANHNLGVCLEKLGRHDEAAAAFEKSCAANPERWQSWMGLGVSRLHLAAYEAALDAFQHSLQLQPKSDRALFGKAVALQRLGRLEESLDLYRRILPNNANNPEILGNLLALCVAREDHARVREYSDRLLKLRPQSRLALEGLITASLARNDYKSAAQYGSQLVKMSPDCFEAWYDLGFANQQLERYDQASHAYDKATRLKADAAAFANLGLILAARGDAVGARKAHERAIELAPSNPGPLWNLSLFYAQQGDAEEAELALEQLVELKPDWPEAWFRLGLMRLARTDYPSAAEAFDLCLKLRPGWPDAALNGGISRYHAGDLEGARRGFQAAATAGLGEGWKGLAAVSAANGEGARAADEYEKAAGFGVKCGELAYNVGLALQNSGDCTGAATYYGDAVKHQPDLPEALLNLGHALHQLGQEDDARCCWAKALEANPAFAAEYFD